jgi:hypothetical protein
MDTPATYQHCSVTTYPLSGELRCVATVTRFFVMVRTAPFRRRERLKTINGLAPLQEYASKSQSGDFAGVRFSDQRVNRNPPNDWFYQETNKPQAF